MTLKIHTETGLWGETREYYLFTSELEARKALGVDFAKSYTAWPISRREYRVYLP